MKKLTLLLPLLGLTIACGNSNNNQAQSDSTATDTAAVSSNNAGTGGHVNTFISEALHSGMMEVELGNLAQKQAADPRVKAFGAMMVKDHTMAGEELKAIAAKKNITPSSQMSNDHMKDMEDLKKETGVNFDKKYIKMMLSAHRKDINKFEDMSKNEADADLKAFAAKTLPRLQLHLDSAKSINKKVKGSLDPNDISDAMERQPLH